MVGPFFKRKPYSSSLLSRRYSARVILRYYSFCDCTLSRVDSLITTRRFMWNRLLPPAERVLSTGVFLLASLFALPGRFVRPSRTGSREWNHSKSDYDMRRAFKALPHPLPTRSFLLPSHRVRDFTPRGVRKCNSAGECVADRYRILGVYLKSLYGVHGARPRESKRPTYVGSGTEMRTWLLYK